MPCPIAPIGLSIKHSGTKMAVNNGAAASSQEFTPLLISKILERLNRDSDDEALFGQYIANFLRRLQTQKEKSNFRIELENLMQKYQVADEHWTLIAYIYLKSLVFNHKVYSHLHKHLLFILIHIEWYYVVSNW